MTAHERRDEIIQYLSERRKSTIRELMTLYDVGRNTIRSDLIAITACIPFEVKSGRYGGIFVDKDWYPAKWYYSKTDSEFLKNISASLQGAERERFLAIINQHIRNGEQTC